MRGFDQLNNPAGFLFVGACAMFVFAGIFYGAFAMRRSRRKPPQ